ncbi:MAG: pantetheine-phosphate adenylyltransferase [Chloroflexi bacterium]|nr:pantetheine-phosphate adenylyltransferase [Chloroflexota bacterium]
MIIALYPGTFDPVHNGHLDIACRSAQLWDHVIVAIYDRPDKSVMFPTAERLALFSEATREWPNVDVVSYSGLTVEYAREVGAKVMVRGLRAVSDFEYEYQIALTNKQLAPDIEACSFMTSQDHTFLSSSILKEVAMLGGDISHMCPPHVHEALRQKAQEREAKQQSL